MKDTISKNKIGLEILDHIIINSSKKPGYIWIYDPDMYRDESDKLVLMYFDRLNPINTQVDPFNIVETWINITDKPLLEKLKNLRKKVELANERLIQYKYAAPLALKRL